MGTQITWIAPYKFNQRLPFDVDYKVMGTFLEFYQGLLKFVNFKLFSDVGLQYPLRDMFPQSATSVYYDTVKIKELQNHIGKLLSQAREDDKLVELKDTPEMQQLNQRYEQSKK